MLRTLDDMYRFGQYVVASGMAPRGYDKPEKVIIGVQWGLEIGLTPMQALKSISVINNNPCVWGDAVPALCRRHPKFIGISETWTGEGESRKCTVTMTRSDDANATVRSFGYADAKKAGLLGKDTYMKFLDRMLQCRARAWAAHDCFPDALMGMAIAEEVLDQEYLEVAKPDITSGDTVPLAGLDAMAEVLEQDEVNIMEGEFESDPSEPTPEELADWEREKGAVGVQSDIPF